MTDSTSLLSPVPLVSYASFNQSEVEAPILHYLNNRLIQYAPINEARAHRIFRRFLQACCPAMGVLGTIPFINVCQQFAGNTVFGGFLSFGTVTSYGSLIAWCFLKLVDAELKPLTNVEKILLNHKTHCCCLLATKTGIVAMGVLSQIPYAYLSYEYNDHDLTMPIFVLVADAGIPIYSLSLTIEELQRKRRFNNFEKNLFNTRNQLIELLENKRTALALSNEDERHLYVSSIQAIGRIQASPKEKAVSLLRVLSNPSIIAHRRIYKRCDRYLPIPIAGLFFSIRLVFVALLSYQGANHFTGSDIGSYFFSGFVTSCNAYLNKDGIVNSIRGIWQYALNHLRGSSQRTLSSSLQPKLHFSLTCLSVVSAGLGFGPSAQIACDNFDGGTRIFMGITGSLGIFFVCSYATRNLITDIVEEYIVHNGSKEAKELIILDQELKRFIQLLKKSPLIEFAKLLKALPDDISQKWIQDFQITSGALQNYLERNGLSIEDQEQLL